MPEPEWWRQVKGYLDNENYQKRDAHLASIAALTHWLITDFPRVYHAVQHQVSDLWSWLRRQF
jgi:hypothetical protein